MTKNIIYQRLRYAFPDMQIKNTRAILKEKLNAQKEKLKIQKEKFLENKEEITKKIKNISNKKTPKQ